MKKWLFALFCLCFNAYSAVDVGVFYGTTFGNKLKEFNAKDGGIGHTVNVKAELANKPTSKHVMGLEGEVSLHENFAIGGEFFYAKYKTETGDITINESNGLTYKTTFPKFNTEIYALTPFAVIKQDYGSLTPFIGLGYSVARGIVDNTKFSSDNNYGIGGKKTSLFIHGFVIKIGAFYNFEKFKIGLQYGFRDYKIADTNQQFRSFNTGFTGGIKSQQITIHLRYIV